MPDKGQSQEALDESAEDTKHRIEMLNPRFDLIENHFGCAIPPSLRVLYNNHEEILKVGIFVEVQPGGKPTEFYVESYNAINQHSIWETDSHDDLLEFATCISEVCYVIDPKVENPEVCAFTLGTHELQPLGFTLSQFINAPRRYEKLD